MNLSGNPIDYLIAFLGGIFLSFTPCVYPLIPVSASFIGLQAGASRRRGFALSLVYVSGVAIIYSALGLFASLTGKIFGTVSSNPITYIFVGAVIILFGLSMLGLFNLPLLNFKPSGHKGRPGYFSAFLLGLSSGLVISPCVSPVLGGILAYLITKKSIFYGTTLLLVFAYGMGLVLVLAGTFSSILLALPKAGKWMQSIQRLCALILIGMGIYFIAIAAGRF